MPKLKDFEDLIAGSNGTASQFVTTKEGGVAFKSKAGRLTTYLSSFYQDTDKAVLRSFKDALTEAHGAKAVEIAWKKAGLDVRLQSGLPLSVREATMAIQAAKTSVAILAENETYKAQYVRRETEAKTWDLKPQVSQVDGTGLRLVRQDQGEFRLHHWNAKNNPESLDDKKKAAELDELVEKEVAAIKAEQLKASGGDNKVEPMSERLMYLQAKLNLTERMVSDACRSGNLKDGGAKANIFLGPDMFFSPSNGPKVKGFACEKTTGGAYTEEEMKRLTQGLRRISERHPDITLMPGTIVWSKPAAEVPVIDGLPRPADMVYNTAPVFHGGDLTHITYKMTDGGDATWAATGINGPGGNFHTPPSASNQHQARLQVFLGNDLMNGAIGAEGMEKVKPILDAMGTQASQLSPGREWENGLRKDGAGVRSPYNTIFKVEDKVVALEICRDHTNGQAKKEYTRLKDGDDSVAKLAKAQEGPGGGANLHVLLSASNALMPNSTICCSGGVAAQNDVSGGASRSYHIERRLDANFVKVKMGSQQLDFYDKPDPQRKKLVPESSGVGLSGVDVKSESVKPVPTTVQLSESDGDRATLEPRPSVRTVMQGGAVSAPKTKLDLGQTETEVPTVDTGIKTVRSETGLVKPTPKVSTGPETVTVRTGTLGI